MKSFVLVVMVFCIPMVSNAQSSDSLLAQAGRKWNNAKAYTLGVAMQMPDADYNYKPVPEEMSFKQQLLHIAQNINWLSTAYLLSPAKTPDIDTATNTKAAVLQIVSDAYDRALTAQQQLTAQQLDEVVPFFAGPMSRRQILFLLHDHQTHHVGQLIVYLRLNGFKPPPYVGW